jgi:Protein of unknown function (DUF4232)
MPRRITTDMTQHMTGARAQRNQSALPGAGIPLPNRYRGASAELRIRGRIEGMTKALVFALALASIVAGCRGGAREAGPVPTVPASRPPASTVQATSGGTTESTSTNASTPAIALCTEQTTAVRVASQEGAAGTISTLWRVTNTGQKPCRSFGYPGMDFHTASRWLNVQVHRGGFPNINQPPAPVVLAPGESLYFVSYWNDVQTNAGPCKQFDRVKVTLPDNFVSAKLTSSGCLNPRSVDVGPVTANPPS